MKNQTKLSNEQFQAIAIATGAALGLAVRGVLAKKGSVKSFWWGVPHKMGTFKK